MVLNPFCLRSTGTTAPKPVFPPRNPICTKSVTRMESQEGQQAAVSVTEFNKMKNELRNLTRLMIVMMRKFDNQIPSPVAQDSGSLVVPLQEAPTSQHVPTPSIHVNMPQSVPHFKQQEPS